MAHLTCLLTHPSSNLEWVLKFSHLIRLTSVFSELSFLPPVVEFIFEIFKTQYLLVPPSNLTACQTIYLASWIDPPPCLVNSTKTFCNLFGVCLMPWKSSWWFIWLPFDFCLQPFFLLLSAGMSAVITSYWSLCKVRSELKLMSIPLLGSIAGVILIWICTKC